MEQQKRGKKIKDKKNKRSAKIVAPHEEAREKKKAGLFRNVSQIFSGQKEILPKSPRDSATAPSPKSARQRFPETPSSIRLTLTDGVLFEGVLLVDDIFENKGVLVDLTFRVDQIELTSPSTRLKLPTAVQRFPFREIPSFRLYDKLHVWEFQWLEPPINASVKPIRRVFKFKDLRFKELNESAKKLVSESVESKRAASEVQVLESISARSQPSIVVSTSESQSDVVPSSTEVSSIRDEDARKDMRFTELYYDICDILLEETADGEYVTLADLADMIAKDRLPWQTSNTMEEALWEFCSLYPETFSLEEDETDRLVVGLLSFEEMLARLEEHILSSPLHRARPAIVTHTVFSREALRGSTLDEFVHRSRVFKWHGGYLVMRKSAVIAALRDALTQKQEEVDELQKELEHFRQRRARKLERRRRRRHASESRSPSPSPNREPHEEEKSDQT